MRIEADGFTSYLATMARALEAERLALEQRVDEVAQTLTADERDDWNDHHSDQWRRIAEEFPTLFFNSYLVALCSFTEAELNNLCLYYEVNHPGAPELRKYAGKGVRRAQDYLKKVGGIAFPDTSPEWQRLLLYTDIRNAIAHTEGSSTNLDPQARRLLDRHKCVSDDIFEQIQLSREFCEEALAQVFALFRKLEVDLPADLKNW